MRKEGSRLYRTQRGPLAERLLALTLDALSELNAPFRPLHEREATNEKAEKRVVARATRSDDLLVDLFCVRANCLTALVCCSFTCFV